MSREPLRALLHPVALLAFAAAAQAWLDGAAVRGVVAAVLGVLVAGATEAARRRVVPEAKIAGAVSVAKSGRSSWGREDGLGTLELIGLLCLAGIVVLIVLAV